MKSGIQFNKGFGQHILKNPLVVSGVKIKASDTSTEVQVQVT